MNDPQNIANPLKVLACRITHPKLLYTRARTYGKGKPLPASREHFQWLSRHSCDTSASRVRHAPWHRRGSGAMATRKFGTLWRTLAMTCHVKSERLSIFGNKAGPVGRIRMRRSSAHDFSNVAGEKCLN